MNKILVYLKGFTASQRKALAQITALWLAAGQLPATILPILINVSLKKSQYFSFTIRLTISPYLFYL